jgi:hypothetical protein
MSDSIKLAVKQLLKVVVDDYAKLALNETT